MGRTGMGLVPVVMIFWACPRAPFGYAAPEGAEAGTGARGVGCSALMATSDGALWGAAVSRSHTAAPPHAGGLQKWRICFILAGHVIV